MRRLPLAYECERRFADLDGSGAVRHCGECDRGHMVFARTRKILAAAAAAAVLLAAPAHADTSLPPPHPEKKEKAPKGRGNKKPAKRPQPDEDVMGVP